MLEFRILGPLEVRRNQRVVPLSGQKQRGLLALLLLHANEVVSRDRLIDELWSDEPPDTARNTLQVHVSRLRKTLERAGADSSRTLVTRPPGYVLQVPPDRVDAHRFERLVATALDARAEGDSGAAGGLLAEALGLWRGAALADLNDEPFAQPEIGRLEELRLHALEESIECELERGRHAELVGEIEALIAQYPLRERLRRLLMLALYRSERQADALAAFRDARSKLNDELGIEPSQALTDLNRSILRQEPVVAAPTAAARPEPVPLPHFIAPFIGREQELEDVTDLLRRDHVRLVTLTGLGGIGKTRSAVEVARALSEEFADGAAYVGLATISDPALVAPTIAQALGVGDLRGVPEQLVAEFLADRETLLLVDNFEQVVAAAGVVSRLLGAAPGLKLLVTSRAPLRIAGEHEYPVSLLAVPESLALFMQRAEAVNPSFTLSPGEAEAVEELCVRLDGLPLAIELAATRTRLLSPSEMLNRLDRRFDLLTVGPRDAPERHRALRLTLDWSFDLLTPTQQQLFVRLGVFVGGCTIDAAEAVCPGDAGGVLDDLSAVVEESLVLREQGREPRFRILETVREYALERLRVLGEENDARDLHARYFLALVENADRAGRGPQQAEWLARLELDHHNIRAAQAYARETDQAEMSLRFCVSLWRFWQIHGHLDEGRRALEAALEGTDDGDPLLRARALNGAGVLAGEQGDFEAAREFFEPSLELVRSLGEHERTASVLVNLGNLSLFAGEYDRARRLYEMSIEYSQLSGSWGHEALGRENLGLVALDQGALDEAVALFEQSAALYSRARDDRGCSSSTRALAAALLERGEIEHSRRLLSESLELARRLGELNGIAYCLDTFAGLAAAEDDPERAAQLFGAADGLRASIGALRPPDQQPLYERWVASTLARVATPLYTSRYEAGRSLTLDEACSLAVAPDARSAATDLT